MKCRGFFLGLHGLFTDIGDPCFSFSDHLSHTPIKSMQHFTALPEEQQLRSESSLTKFIRRIKKQLNLYELSDYAHLNEAELPYASISDLSKRRQASALIKQSITEEVLNQFPDEYTGRQIIRALEMLEHQTSSDPPTRISIEKLCNAKDSIIEAVTSGNGPDYEMTSYRLPKLPLICSLSRTLHPILPQPVEYVNSSRPSRSPTSDMRNSGVISHETSDAQDKRFVCEECSKSYQGSRQLQRHMLKHRNPNKYKCTVPGCDKTTYRMDAIRSHIKVHERRLSAQKEFAARNAERMKES
jgi:hypothetical protein